MCVKAMHLINDNAQTTRIHTGVDGCAPDDASCLLQLVLSWHPKHVLATCPSQRQRDVIFRRMWRQLNPVDNSLKTIVYISRYGTSTRNTLSYQFCTNSLIFKTFTWSTHDTASNLRTNTVQTFTATESVGLLSHLTVELSMAPEQRVAECFVWWPSTPRQLIGQHHNGQCVLHYGNCTTQRSFNQHTHTATMYSFTAVCFRFCSKSKRHLLRQHALIAPILTHPVLFTWHFLYQFHRLTTLIIHHPFTLSFQA